jgi:glycosyltransferase involved in cell wall biosynthesis
MSLVYLPTVVGKHVETPVHTFLSTLHLGAVRRPDAAIYFICGNSPFAGLARLFGVPSAINVDGLDSRRAKWGPWAKRYLRLTEHGAPRLACVTITDSREVQELYRTWGYETLYIPYGSEFQSDGVDDAALCGRPAKPETAGGNGHSPHPNGNDGRRGGHGSDAPPASVLEELGVKAGDYVLFVGRLVPENNAHVLVEAFSGLDTRMRLIVVGDAPYAEDYQARLRATGDERILFAGYRFGPAYRELLRGSALFVAPTEVGGTHPVIVEAMAAGACVVVNDHPPNVEALGDAGVSYPRGEGAEGLRRALAALLADPARMARCRAAAAERASRLYSWDAVTDDYERVAIRLAQGRAAGRIHPAPDVHRVPRNRR